MITNRHCRAAAMAALTWAACFASTATAQPGGRDFGDFLGLASSTLIDIPEVRTELKIEDEQDDLLDALAKDLSNQRRAVVAGGTRGGPTNPDWFEKLQSQLTAFDRRSEELISIVLEPKQTERLAELRLQREGARALLRADVQSKLELTDEQKKNVTDSFKPVSAPQFGPNLNFGQRREERAKQDKEVLATLTDEQKTRWEAMKGEPFDFPSRRRRGRR